MWQLALTVCFLTLFDQGTKFFAQSLIPDEGFFLFPFFALQFFLNKTFWGFSFSQAYYIAASIAFLAAWSAVYYRVLRSSEQRPYVFLGTSLLLSGIVSNMIDRIRFGGVVDWMNFNGVGIFNFADVFIITGTVLLAWYFFKIDQKKGILKSN
ncbi:signal peptidase II [Candidatus Uhrbacteria bacterium]|nr:signal peptidase II [Candidatus Uhrbacteria bacterium]